MLIALIISFELCVLSRIEALPLQKYSNSLINHQKISMSSSLSSSSSSQEISNLKYQILQLGAALDRGQAYNPTSGTYYSDRMQIARNKIESLIQTQSKPLSTTLDTFHGEWELILSTVPHGIFRSSPFFLAIQSAYDAVGEVDKAELFFKLHELQTCSWGVSKVGRVAQFINSTSNILISEFDTSLFSLTTIPIIGFGKLLPTFGGCVITVSNVKLTDDGDLDIEVNYTTSKPVEGLAGFGENIWGKRIPVGDIWKKLPWNKGRPASCLVKTKYIDAEFRVMEDVAGEYFVYTRPVASRPPTQEY